MDADLKSRRQVSYDQMEGLLEFLQEHQDLAKGHTRGRRGKLHSLSQWNLCSKKLNPFKDGAVKDGKGWSKYWCDWKYRVRRKAMELKVAKDTNTPPPDGTVPLSHMEEGILALIGEGAVDGVLVKADPLAEESEEDEAVNMETNGDMTPKKQYGTRSKSGRGRKRRHSSRESDRGLEADGPSRPGDRVPGPGSRNRDADDSDDNDDAAKFLRLERENLENSRKMLDSMQSIATELRTLVDVLSGIRDVLFNGNRN